MIGGFTLNAIKVILVFGFLIFIHELGHFLVAKKVGIKVHEFALGFGNKLWSITKGETTYSIRLLPIGGFVRMEGEEQHSDDERSFNKKTIGERMAVVFAGPLMNIFLAVLIFFGLNMFAMGYYSNYINTVEEKSQAYIAGVRPGDKIIKLNDRTIRIWEEVKWIMRSNYNKQVKLTVLRNGEPKDFYVDPYMKLNFQMSQPNIVTSIEEGTGLDRLGLKVGDKIKSINGITINSSEQVEKVIRESDSNRLKFVIERNSKINEKEFDAPFVRQYLIGFTSTIIKGDLKGLFYNSFWKNIFIVKIMLSETYRLLTGKVGMEQLMGPVGIATEISNTQKFLDLFQLGAYISLSLGIANLIPFPPLDGGKILTLSIEAIRRKPLKPENEAMISMVGFSLLILLLIVVSYNDFLRQVFNR